MKIRKRSQQREALVENLANRHDHPTADMLYLSLRETNPKMSLGTVYRNLSLLSKTGEIIKISCGDGVERYDACTTEHSHFVCKCCGKLIDLFPPENGPENVAPKHDEIGRIDSHSFVFYGVCKNCMKNE